MFGYNCYEAVKNYKAAIKRADDKVTVRHCKLERDQAIGEAACESGGAVVGTAVGAAIGSFIPAVGTAIGAIVGSFCGSWLGRMFGRVLSWFF